MRLLVNHGRQNCFDFKALMNYLITLSSLANHILVIFYVIALFLITEIAVTLLRLYIIINITSKQENGIN